MRFQHWETPFREFTRDPNENTEGNRITLGMRAAVDVLHGEVQKEEDRAFAEYEKGFSYARPHFDRMFAHLQSAEVLDETIKKLEGADDAD